MIKLSSFINVFVSQLVILISSILLTFLLPKIIGINHFGYWQVYVFYTSYVGLFQLGFNDGIYLKYGGYNYNELQPKVFNPLFFMLLISQVVFSVIIIYVVTITEDDSFKRIALIFTSANILVLGTNAFFVMINQITGRFKQYSYMIILEKIIVIGGLFLLFYFKTLDFYSLIIMDFSAKVAILILNI